MDYVYAPRRTGMIRQFGPPIPFANSSKSRLWMVYPLASRRGYFTDASHANYREISYVDDKVGTLVGALEKNGIKDDTIIVITSDHGEMLGERGMWYRMSFFEWASRVPLIIWAPGRFSPRRVNQPVSLVDLLPTLTEISSGDKHITYADAIDGKSLLPLLKGGDEDETAVVCCEILCEGAISPIVMLRRDRYKYIYYDVDPEQLYDLENDPDETNNLAGCWNMKKCVRRFIPRHQKSGIQRHCVNRSWQTRVVDG